MSRDTHIDPTPKSVLSHSCPFHSNDILTQEYMRNIKVVDDVVRLTENLFTDYYGDAETSFIFTADHGMSKIGNHGDGGLTSTIRAPNASLICL